LAMRAKQTGLILTDFLSRMQCQQSSERASERCNRHVPCTVYSGHYFVKRFTKILILRRQVHRTLEDGGDKHFFKVPK
jgi:hypothetical protein